MNPFFSKSLQLSKTSTQFNLLLKLSNISFQLIKSNIQKIETNLSGISDSTYTYIEGTTQQLSVSHTALIYTLIFTVLKNLSKHFIPASVSSPGSSWRRLDSKKSLFISGSRSGSSPISLLNHLKHCSRSEGKI